MTPARYISEKSLIFSQKSLSVSIPRVVTIYPQKGWIFRRTDLTIPFERDEKIILFKLKNRPDIFKQFQFDN